MPGEARYREIRAAVEKVIAGAYGRLPTEDLATAARVLIFITARLNAVLAAESKPNE
jgi:hypothetical protein